LRKTAPKERRGPRERFAQLLGTTRKARLVSAATTLAIVAAILAFVALNADEGIPRDAYTIAADRICLEAKRDIVSARKDSGGRTAAADPNAFARALVPIVGGWRAQLQELSIPSDRVEQAGQLEAALLEAEIRIAQLARIVDRGNGKATLAGAKRADEASANVEEAVADLGLSECASAIIGFSPSPS
jgi:hypothetical protein